VCAGQTLALRHTSAGALSTATLSEITVGARTVAFRSTTAATPVAPPAPTPTTPVATVAQGRYGGALGEAVIALGAAALAREAVRSDRDAA
jgi:hypothetical protein